MDTQLIALGPHQLADAQTKLIAWCEDKMEELRSELTTAHGVVEALRTAKMSDARGRRIVTSVNKRVTFYEKLKAALEAGYYILPPIPHQTFAIRTNRAQPPETRATGGKWKADEPTMPTLPAGEGEYHNATVERQVVDTVQKNEGGKLITQNVWGNVAWKDIEFPFFPVKPEIIAATGKALERKIFDWIGVAPQYRATDPMVVGCIRHWKPHTGPVHFFVAWWLDVDTL